MSVRKKCLIRVASLEDLLRSLVASPISIIYYTRIGGKHVYFSALPTLGELMVHYVVLERELKPYVAYNSVTGEIVEMDKPTTDARLRQIPVVKVVSQNIIEEEDVAD